MAIAIALCAGLPGAYAQDGDPAPEPEAPATEPDPAMASEPGASEDVPAGLIAARVAINDAQYEVALTSLQSALGEGISQPQTVEEIYRLQGETLVAIGKASEAKASFKALLSLNASASLGEFASPKIALVLEEARTELAGGQLEAGHSVAEGTRRVEIAVTSDPVEMSAKVRLSYPRDDQSVAKLEIPLEGGKAIFDVPAQAGSSLVLAVLDHFGNVILLWDVDDMPPAAVAITEVVINGDQNTTSPPRETPLWAKWWVWAGATGAMATVGTVFGIASRSAQSDLDEVTANPGDHFTSDARRLEDKAKSRATVANVSFVLAAALGVTSGVMYWRGRNAEASLQVVPATEGAGASLIMGGRF